MSQITIPQAIDLALQHHRANRLREAEQIYRQILSQQPDHPDALHYLGLLSHQAGRCELAADLIRQAIAHKSNYPEAHYALGNVLKDMGQLDDAIAAYHQAIALRPALAEAHNNLGIALIGKQKMDDAVAAFRQAIVLRANYPEAHNNLGNVLKGQGQLDQAIAAYRQAVALAPTFSVAHFNLGFALGKNGQLDKSIAAYRQAIALNPSYPEAQFNLGTALVEKGKLEESIAAFRQAVALKPNYHQAYINLGNALKEAGQPDQAIAAYRQAISLKPDFAETYSNLGNALADKGQLDEAVAALRQAVAMMPDSPEAHNNLGTALKDRGQLDDAIAAYRQAIALNPNFAAAHSNLIYTLQYHPACDSQAIPRELQHWNNHHARSLQQSIRAHENDRDPDRRLRIGYVSADFWAHASAFFLVPLLENHDRRQVEVICYSQRMRPDATTARMQKNVSQWRNTLGVSDEQLAAQIRADRIDILIDLKVHTDKNRLPVFARKPAPVQATWLGYPGSTGLDTIDYRLSDPYLDPPGMDESIYSERTIRLPDTFWCYDPLDGREIAVNPLPALALRIVTFGCLNNFCKINHDLLALWAQVLRQVEGSRLLLLADPGDHRRRTADCFAQHGVENDRVEFLHRRPRQQYLDLYHRIDVGLDSFPYNGHTTSLDSLWMGVPVLTLVGDRAVSRAGWSQLSNLGLTELAGHTPEQFVRIAVELAQDIPRLVELRSTLRRRMEQSPLMDAAKFAGNMEAAYRQMWHTWCQTESGL